ncbi:2-aminoethanethiol dioxygenase [Diorhabda sublineata]|uniref:2-aminoethanethiol dioxygenase n=1 Tax=Diorhabda sublineata TaxID=1163346 RepID=UPI0024E056F6|nr:2-aminoethanethiol dioxygenase [Diorhabda sublineata]
MASQIQKVLKQALLTFTSKPNNFISNLDNLSQILDKTVAEDLNFDITAVNKDGEGAPVTYIDVYEDNLLTMGIFVVQKDKKLPLHNHPEMYGLIKVLAGKIRVISYSINTPKTIEVDTRSTKDANTQTGSSTRILLMPDRNARKQLITAELVSNDIVGVESKPCILDPNKRNIHEIHSVDGPAAFIDILAPPYNTEIPGVGIRYCSYYSILSNVLPNVFRLQEIRNPSWYWTDTLPYLGPNPAANLKEEEMM